jgi:hypothetical protein
MFWRNISPLSSGSKNKPIYQHESRWQAQLFNPEDGGDVFLQNIVCLSVDYTVLYSRR